MKRRHGFIPWPRLLLITGLFFCGSVNLFFVAQCRPEELVSLSSAFNPAIDQELEQKLFVLTNQYRIQRGLPALEQDETLARIAREHSAGMASQGFISHSLPFGDLKIRMNRAGYRHEIARENVASAPSVLEAHRAMVSSPPHASNILAADVTRVGIGIIRYPPHFDNQLYITQIFVAQMQEFQTAEIRDTYINRVIELANQNGLGPNFLDPTLEKLASHSVFSLDMPLKKEQIQSLLSKSSVELQNKGMPSLSRLGVDVQLLHNPKKLRIPRQVREGQARLFGTAVRRVVDNDKQPAYIVLTLMGYTDN